jgi:hypothetical protein
MASAGNEDRLPPRFFTAAMRDHGRVKDLTVSRKTLKQRHARDGSFGPEVKSVFKLLFMSKPPFYLALLVPR